MLFGSTGVGKSTFLHLVAGAKFSREAVEVDGDDEEFGGGGLDMQLVADIHIPGCEIGNSASSTTLLLNSHVDSNTGLTFVDTPGFGNVGDGEDEDTTVDAANASAIMKTIRSCRTLRIVFLISVKDQLSTTRGGQIKSIFSVLEKFIQDSSTRLSSIFMIFTHCDGFSSAPEGDSCATAPPHPSLLLTALPQHHGRDQNQTGHAWPMLNILGRMKECD
jgi:energy-coupling factor transporter ATP-binding protein EcfA2